MVSKKTLIILSNLIKVNPATLHEHFRLREVTPIERVEGPVAIRLDGVNFSKALKQFEKPRDLRVHEALLDAGKALTERFNALVTYITSDEINVVLDDVPYGGRVFKLISVTASIASAHASLRLGIPIYFDSRVIKLKNLGEAVAYVIYRGRVCANNYISHLFHEIRGRGEVTPSVEIMLDTILKTDALKRTRDWEILGSCIYWGARLRNGVNPVTGERCTVLRRKLVTSETLLNCIFQLLNSVSAAQ